MKEYYFGDVNSESYFHFKADSKFLWCLMRFETKYQKKLNDLKKSRLKVCLTKTSAH